jgi:hypothetical protein
MEYEPMFTMSGQRVPDPKPGAIQTCAFIFCADCRRPLRSMGGPGHNTYLCGACVEKRRERPHPEG